jgi:hypothetical protein
LLLHKRPQRDGRQPPTRLPLFRSGISPISESRNSGNAANARGPYTSS